MTIVKRIALALGAYVLVSCGNAPDENADTSSDELEGPVTVTVAVGVHERNPRAFDPAGHWKDLNSHHARIIVAWNVADVPDRKAKLDAWMTAVRAARVEPFVVFEPFEGPESPEAKAPRAWPFRGENRLDFATAFHHFRQAWPDVKVFAAWNEPNNPNYIARTPSGARLNDASCSSAGLDSCGPHLVAKYYLAMRQQCPDCDLVAGELLGADTEYADKYRQMLGGEAPSIWGFHNYGDVLTYERIDPKHCQPGHTCEVRQVLDWLDAGHGGWNRTHLWITEISPYYNAYNGKTGEARFYGEAKQAKTVRWLLNLDKIDRRLTRIYFFSYYGYCDGPGCGSLDSGLVVGQTGHERRAFEVIAQRRYPH
jgi:hypothetical protein